MKILLTGATGYIAKRLLPVLLENRHEVVCCVRDTNRFDTSRFHNDPVFPVESEPDGESHLVWMLTPPGSDYFYCRMTGDPVEFSLFDERYEASRERSIFNQRLYARRNYPGELIHPLGEYTFFKDRQRC